MVLTIIHFEFKLHQISINFESYWIPFVIYWKTSKQLLFMPCDLPKSYLHFYLCDRENLKSSDSSSWNNILGMHPLGVLIICARDDWHIVAINSIDTCAFMLKQSANDTSFCYFLGNCQKFTFLQKNKETVRNIFLCSFENLSLKTLTQNNWYRKIKANIYQIDFWFYQKKDKL